jgi:hypothetical protein
LAGVVALILAGALALDMARLWAVRSELRVFTEALALAAARELDGTHRGIERARAVVLQQRLSPVAAMLVQRAEAEFAESAEGPWKQQPEPDCRCGYVRVRTLARVPSIGLAPLGRTTAGAVITSAVGAMSAVSGVAAGTQTASEKRVGDFTHP